MLCRRLSRREIDVSPELAAWLPESSADARVAIGGWMQRGGGSAGSFLALAGPVHARCTFARICELVLSWSGAEVTAELPLAQLARWPAVRDRVNALLREATGRGLDLAPGVVQPEGEVLPSPS